MGPGSMPSIQLKAVAPAAGDGHPARVVTRAAGAALVCASGVARAAGTDTLDAVAEVLAWVVLIVAPLIGIAVFWMVHVLPEKIAHKRHHPQTQAIQTLCLLSLVFGGLLWPIAWLWAFTRPVGYKLAYGTEKGEHYFEELGERARAGELPEAELVRMKHELDAMRERGPLPPHLAKLRDDLGVVTPGAPAEGGSG